MTEDIKRLVENAGEIDRLCDTLSLDWDARRQAFIGDGHIINRKDARLLAALAPFTTKETDQ